MDVYKVNKLSMAVILACGLGSQQTNAEVILDGTLGQSGALRGPEYAIIESLGQRRGNNLFHSFSDFNLNAKESAVFSGAKNIQNIISRVTGGNVSNINGKLQSTIRGADFYFINPNGVVFGENATLDVSGSFYTSTADYLRLGKDGRFDVTSPKNSVLTTSVPSSFGFLDSSHGSIVVNGSYLKVPSTKKIALIASNLSVKGITDKKRNIDSRAYLIAGRGDISLLAVGDKTKTDVSVDSGSYDVNESIYTGNVDIERANIFSGGDGAGTIFIRGGNLTVKEHSIINSTNTPSRGGRVTDNVANKVGIDIVVGQNISISNGSKIKTSSGRSSLGGDINITSSTLKLDESGQIVSSTITNEKGGNINITTEELKIDGGNTGKSLSTGLYATSYFEGEGGDINIAAKSIEVGNYGQISNFVRFGGANSGDINIKTGSLNLFNGASIESRSSFYLANSGDINIVADDITITGVSFDSIDPFLNPGDFKNSDATGIFMVTANGIGGVLDIAAQNIALHDRASIVNYSDSDGAAEDTTINFNKLNILSGSKILTGSNGKDNIGSSLLLTGKELVVSGVDNRLYDLSSRGDFVYRMSNSAISSESRGDGGQAGNISIDVMSLSVLDGGQINSSTTNSGNAGDINITANNVEVSGINKAYQTFLDKNNDLKRAQFANSLLSSAAVQGKGEGKNKVFNTGSAGFIDVSANNITISNSALVTSQAPDIGFSGKVKLSATDLLSVTNAKITTETGTEGSGGRIDLKSNKLVLESSIISTQTRGGGDSGDILFDANSIELKSSSILAETTGKGRGGNIVLDANSIALKSSLISTSSSFKQSGVAGNINIKSSSDIVADSSKILTSSATSNGGNIKLDAPNLIYLLNSTIASSVSAGKGNGGNISIDPEFIVLNHSNITADAQGGNGGNITLVADNLLLSPDSKITASSSLGVDGSVVLNAPSSTLGGELETVPEVSQDASKHFRNDCVAVGSGFSRFITTNGNARSNGSKAVASSSYYQKKTLNLASKNISVSDQPKKNDKPALVLAKKGVDCVAQSL